MVCYNDIKFQYNYIQTYEGYLESNFCLFSIINGVRQSSHIWGKSYDSLTGKRKSNNSLPSVCYGTTELVLMSPATHNPIRCKIHIVHHVLHTKNMIFMEIHHELYM